ncbi:hypothetical protein SAMN05444362_1421, partial [Dysgonomonas macrotermitis]
YFYNHGRIVQNKASIGTDPYGKPAQVFLYEGSMEEMAEYMGRMLRSDLKSNLDLELYRSNSIKRHITEATPQPEIPTEKIKEEKSLTTDESRISGDLNPLWQTDGLDPFWQTLEDDWFTGGKAFREKERKTVAQTPAPESKPQVDILQPIQQESSDQRSQKQEVKEKTTYQSLEVNVSDPVISLYDLFGFTQEERTQVKPARSKKQAPAPKGKPVQLSMFSKDSPLNPPRGTSVPPLRGGQEGLYPIEDARIAEQQQEERKRSFEPRPYSGELFEFHKKGSLVEDNGQAGFLKERYRDDAVFQALDISFEQRAKISRYIEIRDTYHTLYNHEAEHLTEHASLRGNLNLCYDNFVKRYGYLNDKKNLDLIKMDAGGREILSLERSVDGNLQKADIFSMPVAFNPNEITVADTSNEALIASLNKYGEVRLDYMESLLSGKNREEIVSELQGRIYFNPLIQNYEVQDRFIAGNVVEKAEAIKRYISNHPDDLPSQTSLKALQEATPQPIRYEELDFNFGERWIDTGAYEDYIGKLFETDVDISYYASRDDFTVKADKSNMIINEKFAVQGENRLYTGMHLLKHSLLNT